MPNAIYPKFKEALWLQSTNSNANTGTVKVALVDTGVYTYSAAHEFLTSLTGVVGTAQTVGSKTFTDGVFDGTDVTYTAVTGNSAEALVFYIDTGTAATSRLVSYIDSGFSGLPVTPNGGDITLSFNASGIFAL
ncbi:MAG: hypothetical protein ACK5R5_00635 [Alphaproteobacteria bacterium]|jgi:hypothetical protein